MRKWMDKLGLCSRRGVHGVVWVVWDEFDGETEGATVGEIRPDLEEQDKEYAAVHRAVEAFWESHPDRANWVKGGFWFGHEANAREALSIARKSLADCRAQSKAEKAGE